MLTKILLQFFSYFLLQTALIKIQYQIFHFFLNYDILKRYNFRTNKKQMIGSNDSF